MNFIKNQTKIQNFISTELMLKLQYVSIKLQILRMSIA